MSGLPFSESFEEQAQKKFNLGFVIVSLLGLSLAFFISSAWNDALEKLITVWSHGNGNGSGPSTDAEHKQNIRKMKHSFIVAGVATVVAVLVVWVMFEVYTLYAKTAHRHQLLKSMMKK